MVRRTRLTAVLTLAMINVFTLAAGIAVARMLPSRLAALRVPSVAAGRVSGAGTVLAPGTWGPARCRPRAACGPPWPARCPRPRSAPRCRWKWPTRPPGGCCFLRTGPGS